MDALSYCGYDPAAHQERTICRKKEFSRAVNSQTRSRPAEFLYCVLLSCVWRTSCFKCPMGYQNFAATRN